MFDGAKFRVGGVKVDLVYMPNGMIDLLRFHLNTDLVRWRWFDPACPKPQLHKSIRNTPVFVLNHEVLSKPNQSPMEVARARIAKAKARMQRLHQVVDRHLVEVQDPLDSLVEWASWPEIDNDLRMARWDGL